MIIAIDASNIRSGGGLTHLKHILEDAKPEHYNIQKIIIWSNEKTLKQLPDYKWLQKENSQWLNKSFIHAFIFQAVFLSRLLLKYNVSVLFVPGGSFLGSYKNVVSMSQNMLPFEETEYKRFQKYSTRLRFKILRITQGYTFKKSKGVIFLTEYAKKAIGTALNLKNKNIIIPHGINTNFLQQPKNQKSINEYSFSNPYRLLYVSIITAYKHQWNVAEAVLKLRQLGYPVILDLVGEHDLESMAKLSEILKKDENNIINVRGLVAYEELANIYKEADGFVFASSCENMPIILIEAMTAGLPIASSNKGPMPEILGRDGFYFDPLNVDNIFNSLKEMLDNEKKRAQFSVGSYNKSLNYTWKDCSERTFEYLSQIK
ncbi:hypothetical protein BAZ12_19930 [Elizabethkingia miricola]|uniref:Glycosyl transferase family 1 domain-containing protein n=1 Tax=Elizabethkingia miricola TaxID=172045 RepID=A0AAQ1SYV7_ELIMR|nr:MULTISPECIES: glycosyltransferase family 1 protein [Elizabethkingia]KUY16991.1 hypothetical protein ATB95_11430 [Elizabethkingia miricola]MCL1654725.1 glycosyltransferase family 4 protein [Elizabethkingia miricola]OPC34823.1 hypothetical protein BAX99_08180 [Elizabethkingia miricola]OPC72459.1 hypothetical protein BAZ13_07110 [Elizabethkingia miricola]OPC76277.1 hypothetical protein BAZ12_19930 [Elizabethkingia miricola]